MMRLRIIRSQLYRLLRSEESVGDILFGEERSHQVGASLEKSWPVFQRQAKVSYGWIQVLLGQEHKSKGVMNVGVCRDKLDDFFKVGFCSVEVAIAQSLDPVLVNSFSLLGRLDVRCLGRLAEAVAHNQQEQDGQNAKCERAA